MTLDHRRRKCCDYRTGGAVHDLRAITDAPTRLARSNVIARRDEGHQPLAASEAGVSSSIRGGDKHEQRRIDQGLFSFSISTLFRIGSPTFGHQTTWAGNNAVYKVRIVSEFHSYLLAR